MNKSTQAVASIFLKGIFQRLYFILDIQRFGITHEALKHARTGALMIVTKKKSNAIIFTQSCVASILYSFRTYGFVFKGFLAISADFNLPRIFLNLHRGL